jgi:hypothetical protein
MGRPGQIRSHAIGRRESWAFADQDQAATGSKTGTNRVADADSSLLNKRQRRDAPGIREKFREQLGEHGDGVALNGQSRQSVGDRNGEIVRSRAKQGGGVGVEGPAEIRPAEIGGAIRCVTSQLEDCQ